MNDGKHGHKIHKTDNKKESLFFHRTQTATRICKPLQSSTKVQDFVSWGQIQLSGAKTHNIQTMQIQNFSKCDQFIFTCFFVVNKHKNDQSTVRLVLEHTWEWSRYVPKYE